MKNYKMIITYDGTRYYGWEHQPTTDMTIQGKLESVLSAMTGTEIEVIGAGRTDAGVHAKGMVANAHMETKMKEDEICDYMNRYLPEDICSCNRISHLLSSLFPYVHWQPFLLHALQHLFFLHL